MQQADAVEQRPPAWRLTVGRHARQIAPFGDTGPLWKSSRGSDTVPTQSGSTRIQWRLGDLIQDHPRRAVSSASKTSTTVWLKTPSASMMLATSRSPATGSRAVERVHDAASPSRHRGSAQHDHPKQHHPGRDTYPVRNHIERITSPMEVPHMLISSPTICAAKTATTTACVAGLGHCQPGTGASAAASKINSTGRAIPTAWPRPTQGGETQAAAAGRRRGKAPMAIPRVRLRWPPSASPATRWTKRLSRSRSLHVGGVRRRLRSSAERRPHPRLSQPSDRCQCSGDSQKVGKEVRRAGKRWYAKRSQRRSDAPVVGRRTRIRQGEQSHNGDTSA